MEPAELDPPPEFDPRAFALDSVYWGEEAYHLVHRDGRFYAWVVWPPHDHVYVLPSEDEARDFLRREQAWFLFHSEHGVRMAGVEVVDRDGARDDQPYVLYEAVLVDGGEAGILLATHDGTAEPTRYTLSGFEDLHQAGEVFAAEAERFAVTVGERGLTEYPDIAAAHLRYRAAVARADLSRIVVGDAVRRNQARLRGERGRIPFMAHRVSVSREFLYRVLAGREWARPTQPAQPRNGHHTSTPATTAPPWTVTASCAVEADTEHAAHHTLITLLEAMDVTTAGADPSLTLVGGDDAIWIARVSLDLSGLTEIEPDDALTRLRYTTRNLTGATWRVQAPQGQRQGRFDWPSGWDSREEILVDSRIRAMEIQASSTT